MINCTNCGATLPLPPPIIGPRFYEWNYDTMTCTEYERLGECNGCNGKALCCKGVFNMKMIEGDRANHGGRTVDGKGIWAEVPSDGEREFVRFEYSDEKKACSALTDDNQCEQHGDDKAWCCRVFPTMPSDIAEIPECSYSFRKMSSWEFKEDEDGKE